MIYGTLLELSAQSGAFGGKLKSALDYIRQCDVSVLEPGRHEVQGTDMYMMVFDGVTKPVSELRAESHFQYTDIHYVVEGEERIGFAPNGMGFEVVQDLRDQDALLYERVPGEMMLQLKKGDFVVLFPGEVHRPWVCAEQCAPLRKLVVKLKI